MIKYDSEKPYQKPLTDLERAVIRGEHFNWLKYIARAALDGMLIGLAVGLAIIFFDINSIGSMLQKSQNQMGYTLMLLGGLAHTFGMVSAGMSIWIKATQEEE